MTRSGEANRGPRTASGNTLLDRGWGLTYEQMVTLKADILAIEAEAAAPDEGLRCNCPESGTSGSCPFHDASTLAAPQSVPLDVERLARALHECDIPAAERYRGKGDRSDHEGHLQDAAAIAAAYTEHGATVATGIET